MIDEDEPVVVAVTIEDGRLAERLIAALHEAPGIRLARPGEPADAALVAVDGRAARSSTPIADDMPLTPRELEVLALMAEGASNKAIAQRLGISVHTAKFHVGQVLDKLDATGRTDAVAHAARRGVIQL
ncbi:MAG TPA: LuxR C-terminal-related transcriptional regulator [Caulobacteraceae bacterium]|nr:LuxR C-terminal-related transcriptional regulator [Caulobacteraceae bacterium]